VHSSSMKPRLGKSQVPRRATIPCSVATRRRQAAGDAPVAIPSGVMRWRYGPRQPPSCRRCAGRQGSRSSALLSLRVPVRAGETASHRRRPSARRCPSGDRSTSGAARGSGQPWRSELGEPGSASRRRLCPVPDERYVAEAIASRTTVGSIKAIACRYRTPGLARAGDEGSAGHEP